MLSRSFKKQELSEIVRTTLKEYVYPKTEAGSAVLALHGDLGAGKTTFVQEIARQLGVIETVTSPTFVIMKTYETESEHFEMLVHIDAYRIESLEEARPLKLAEVLVAPRTLVCIEWAERIAELLPKNTINLALTVIDESTRKIVIAKDDARI